jgi:dUTP pyrophosphatase
MIENTVNLRIRRFREGAIMPTRGSELAAGFDLYAWTPEHLDGENYVRSVIGIPPGGMKPIKTGLNIRIPAGYEVQIRPRSGLAFKHQITVQNTPGTIDADYDGDGESFEIVVMLRNEGESAFAVSHGDRIAQMVLNKLPSVVLVEDFEDNTQRNESTRVGGLGSTGVS